MSAPVAGLVRVTVAAPHRRVDLALPENAVVAEMLPILLRHGGEELADDGVDHGGWLLRRSDGVVLASSRTLGSHRVRDGEVLHLVPARQEWPELDYDDLVDAIATGSRRRNPTWTPRLTRIVGLSVGAAALLLALVAVLRSGPDWDTPSRWAIGQAAVLLLAGSVIARALGESAVGTVVGLLALPYAFLGGGLIMAQTASVPAITAASVEVACALLALAGLIGYVGVGDSAVFVAAVTGGLLGLLGSWLTESHGMQAGHSAVILLCASLLSAPVFSGLAVRLGRMPMPTLPRSPADLVRDDPQPPRPSVYAAVARADAVFAGLIMGTAATGAVSAAVLLNKADGTAARWLVVLTTAGFLLRARLYPIIRQRLPMLGAGVVGTAALLLGPGMQDQSRRLSEIGPGLLGLGAVVIMIGLAYSRRPAGPYLRRYVEILELLVVLAVLPVASQVLGLYGRLRGA